MIPEPPLGMTPWFTGASLLVGLLLALLAVLVVLRKGKAPGPLGALIGTTLGIGCAVDLGRGYGDRVGYIFWCLVLGFTVGEFVGLIRRGRYPRWLPPMPPSDPPGPARSGEPGLTAPTAPESAHPT